MGCFGWYPSQHYLDIFRVHEDFVDFYVDFGKNVVKVNITTLVKYRCFIKRLLHQYAKVIPVH